MDKLYLLTRGITQELELVYSDLRHQNHWHKSIWARGSGPGEGLDLAGATATKPALFPDLSALHSASVVALPHPPPASSCHLCWLIWFGFSKPLPHMSLSSLPVDAPTRGFMSLQRPFCNYCKAVFTGRTPVPPADQSLLRH